MDSNCSAGIFSVMRYRVSWNMTSEQLLFITQCSLNNVVYVLNGMKNRNKGLNDISCYTTDYVLACYEI